MRYSIIPAACILITVCCSPSGDSKHSFRTYEEDGVRISVTNDIPEYSVPPLEFTEAFRLQVDESREETLLYDALEYLMDEGGRVYVNDRGNDRIAVFDSDGKFLRSFGRDGDGPGEFRYAQLLWLRDGILAVLDRQLSRTTLFRTDGTLEEIHTWHPAEGRLHELHPLPDGRKVVVHYLFDQPPAGEYHLGYSCVIVTAQGDSLAGLRTPMCSRGRYYGVGGWWSYSNYYFGPTPQIKYSHIHGILCCSSDVPELRWYNLDGALQRVMKLDFDPEPVTDEEKAGINRILDRDIAEATAGQMRDMLREGKKQTIIADTKPFWSIVRVDDAGFLWLRKHRDYTREDPDARLPTFRLLSPAGEYLGDVTWPVRVGDISRGHLLTGQLDPETQEEHYIIFHIRAAVEGLRYPE